MKTLYITIISLLFTGYLFGQEDQNINDDTTKVKIGNMTIIFGDDNEGEEDDFDFNMEDDTLKEKEKGVHTVMEFQIGMNGWLNNANTTTFSSEYENMGLQLNRSRAFGAHFVLNGLDIAKKHLFISPGIGFTWNGYHFENKMVNVSTGADTTIFYVDSAIQYDKYKLRATYVEVPLTVGARIGNTSDTHLTIEAGVIGGFNIGSMVKQRYFINDVKFKNKIKDDYNINPFKLDAILKLRLNRSVGLYGRYSLTTMFEQNKTQEVYPFSLGITIGGI